ncbi:MAG: AIPR family protein [Clostridia bacterium]|nr:AIPR family protein [Clostridia bacterium]
MDVYDFHKDFLEEIKATAATEGAGSNAAFVSVATNYLINAEVLSDFIPAFYLGTGKKNRKIRVDGYVLDEFDLTFNLIIADYTGDETRETITKSVATTQFERLLYFVEEVYESKLRKEVEPSTPASDLVESLCLNKERIRKFRLILLTDGFMSNRISEIEAKSYNGIPVEYQIWDIDRIYRVCFSDLGRQDIEIDFKAYTDGKGIPCLEASSANSEDYKSYLCIIPGTTLADIYDYYGSQLLEGNVRSFLSTKVAVNKKIRETILRIPQNFFAYNNGVSATAMNLHIETTPEGRFITYAKDFQIINGGQTTASLSNARYKDNADLSPIYVQMKLTEVDSNADKASDLIRNISRSSNSQNKVSDADFFATHPFHIRIEQISRRVFAPASGGAQYETKWFYERARGQYLQAQMHMTKSQKEKFTAQNPKKQVITKTDLAKYRNSWAGIPHVVSKGAQTNFMKFAELIDDSWNKTDTSFNDKYFKDSVSLAILFKHTEWIVSHQPWFEQGYRANIVTYSIALLHKLIVNQFKNMDLDLQLIWNRQQVPDVVTNELVKITKYVFETITDPNRGTINVTQWCKRDACWESVKKCPLKLSPEIQKVLLSKEDTKSAEKEARQDQKLISDVEAQAKVLELGAEYWKKVYDFFNIKKLNMSPDQAKAMTYALKIPTQFPSAYQSVQLLLLLETAKSNGFKA